MPQISIQVFSDIHFNVLTSKDTIPPILPLAKYLFLPGNICTLYHKMFFTFLDYCSKKWEKIFIIPGNQDFYSPKHNHTSLNFEYNLKISQRYKNIFYLNNSKASLDENIDVYGSTLWAKPLFNPYEVTHFTDFRSIQMFCPKKQQNTLIDYKFIVDLSNEDTKYLFESISNNTEKKIIIMTHFPPTQTGTRNPIKRAHQDFGNLLDRVQLSNVIVWVSGHTHWSHDIVYNNTRLLSNQLGHAFEAERTRFSETGLFVIDY